jgi:MarR family transcriptional regulator for hemolysin
LEKNGYVSRMADDKDARRNRVTLTDKGRRAVDLGGESFRAVDRQMLAGFSEEEKTQLNGFLIRMLENLGGGDPPPFAPSKKECEQA